MDGRMIPSSAIAAIVVAVVSVVSAGFGYAINGWRMGEEMERMAAQRDRSEADNAVLMAANADCATAVQGARAAMEAITAAAEERERAASEAQREAEVVVKRRLVRVAEIKALPPVPQDEQCAAIVREQAAYVASRRRE